MAQRHFICLAKKSKNFMLSPTLPQERAFTCKRGDRTGRTQLKLSGSSAPQDARVLDTSARLDGCWDSDLASSAPDPVASSAADSLVGAAVDLSGLA